MDISSLLLQFVGSLIAIVMLYGIARVLKLGKKPELQSIQDVRSAADEVVSGYEPVKTSISRDGASAMARNEAGEIMVIKRHGNRFAGRVLDGSAKCKEVVDALIVDPGEAGFGTVRLTLTDAPVWADAINRL